jgi:hypothetical protein
MKLIQEGQREEFRKIVAQSWHEDCEWVPLIAGVEGGRTYRGHDGILAFYDDFWNTFDVHYGEDPEIRWFGSTQVVLTGMSLRGRESGIEMESELGMVFVHEAGLIRRGQAFDSHAAALAAAEELASA